MAEPVWEACAACGREFSYPYLCRQHMLCGFCHPKIAEAKLPEPALGPTQPGGRP